MIGLRTTTHLKDFPGGGHGGDFCAKFVVAAHGEATELELPWAVGAELVVKAKHLAALVCQRTRARSLLPGRRKSDPIRFESRIPAGTD